MKHLHSASDREFRASFESGGFEGQLDHRDHLRLAYIYLVEHDVDDATALMRRALQDFLRRRRIDPAKYHETLTRAWMLAVRHFMETSPPAQSAEMFLALNPQMLDAGIMTTHYSAGLLSSDGARERFAQPDLDPIPRHEDR